MSSEFRVWVDVAQLCRRPSEEKRVVRFQGRGERKDDDYETLKSKP